MLQAELLLLWYISLSMAFFSVIFMSLLIINRVISSAFSRRREIARSDLVEHLLITGPETEDSAVLQRLTRSSVVVAQTIVETSTMVRGAMLDDFIRRLAAFEIEPRLIKLLGSSNPRFRIVAAEALAYFPTPQVRDALWKAFERPGPLGQRILIAQALLSAGAKPELADFLGKFDLHSQDISIDMAGLFTAVARINPEPLVRRARIAYDPPYVRAMMLKTLGILAISESLPVLIRDARDASPLVRASALDAIGTIGIIPDEIGVISDALKDPVQEVRAEAADAVGLLRLRALINELALLIGDRAWDVRFRAAKALLIFGDQGRSVLSDIADYSEDRIASRTAALILDEELYT